MAEDGEENPESEVEPISDEEFAELLARVKPTRDMSRFDRIVADAIRLGNRGRISAKAGENEKGLKNNVGRAATRRALKAAWLPSSPDGKLNFQLVQKSAPRLADEKRPRGRPKKSE